METKKSAFIGFVMTPISGISALTKLFTAGKMQKMISNLLTIAILSGLAGFGGFGFLSPAYGASSWQQEWDRLIANAQKEGKLVIASSMGTEVRRAYTKAFGDKYKISIDFIPGKPAEVAPKLLMERRAGIYSADIQVAGLGTVVPLMGPEGALEPLDKELFLPEVLNLKNWWGGKLLWTDPSHYQLMYFAYPCRPLSINTNLVNANEVRSYDDLLNPKWKGKMSWLDPTMAGDGNEFFGFIAETKSLGFLRAIGKQEVVFTRDLRLQVEWLARGKYPIAIGVKPEVATEFIKNGAPIAPMEVLEGSWLNAASGGVLLLNKAPHPQAARLFLNWLLSREGQTVASQAYGLQSAREDVPTNFLNPFFVRQAGVNYKSHITSEHEGKKREYMDQAREMYGQLLK